MKITHVETFTVNVPTHPTAWHSPEYGPTGWDQADVVLIKLHTDAGIYGLGEAWRGNDADRVLAYRQGLIGRDPLEFNLQDLPIGDHFDHAPGVYQAYEMAMFDLVGKIKEMPRNHKHVNSSK